MNMNAQVEMDRQNEYAEQPKKRRIFVKRVLIVAGAGLLVLITVLALVFDISFESVKDFFTKDETTHSSGTYIAGIPFTDVIAKISVESAGFDGNVVAASKGETATVEVNKDGNIKVNYSLQEGEALIFDRDGLILGAEKQADDFVVGTYATQNVSFSKKSSEIIYCKDADTVARVLRYNISSNELILLWENDLVFDQYLPINAIVNIEKFTNAVNKPMATTQLYDEEKILVEREESVEKVHFGFNNGIPEGQVAIIQKGSEYYVVSQNYTDADITEEGPNHYSIDGNSIARILMYDYESNLIELVYEN